MIEEAGFRIGERFYPLSTRARLPDPALVEKATGITWPEFLERYAALDEDSPEDTLVTIGFLAMSISRKHPNWPRDRVLRYMSEIDEDQVEFVSPQVEDDEPEEDQERAPGDGDPQKEGVNGATASSIPAPTSNSASGALSEASSQRTSGTPTSAT